MTLRANLLALWIWLRGIFVARDPSERDTEFLESQPDPHDTHWPDSSDSPYLDTHPRQVRAGTPYKDRR